MIPIRKTTAKILQVEFQISPETTNILFERGVLTDPACRNFLIKYDYLKQVEPKEKQRLRGRLAEKYCISVKLVEKIVLQKAVM
jgi:hypothetical protein